MPPLYLGELAAMGTAICWTLSTLIWTAMGKRVGALAVSFIRVILTCLLLMAYGLAFRGRPLPTDVALDAWLSLGMAGFCWFFLSDLCIFKAHILIGPRLSLLILSLTPPMAAALSWLCLGDQLSPWRWAAMLVTLAGVVWVVSEQRNGDDHPHTRRDRKRGILLALLAAVVQAVSFVLAKEGVANCDAMPATLISMLGAMVGYITTATLWMRWPTIASAARQRQTMALILLGVVLGPTTGVALNMLALRNAPTGVVATIIATMPVLILPFSAFLHRERFGWRAIFGALAAVGGVAMLLL